MSMPQTPEITLGRGRRRSDPLGDPYERVESVEWKVRHGQGQQRDV
ncbi:hypothetical protein ACFU5O_15675 [Streptomyces sp. NPDC057445]